MNTPFEVDKKLLWICPVPCVRKYLEEHLDRESLRASIVNAVQANDGGA